MLLQELMEMEYEDHEWTVDEVIDLAIEKSEKWLGPWSSESGREIDSLVPDKIDGFFNKYMDSNDQNFIDDNKPAIVNGIIDKLK